MRNTSKALSAGIPLGYMCCDNAFFLQLGQLKSMHATSLI